MRNGRPRLRWADDVGRTKIKNWSKIASVEKHGRKLLSRPKLTRDL